MTDRQTDGQTDSMSIAIPCVATQSHGKNVVGTQVLIDRLLMKSKSQKKIASSRFVATSWCNNGNGRKQLKYKYYWIFVRLR